MRRYSRRSSRDSRFAQHEIATSSRTYCAVPAASPMTTRFWSSGSQAILGSHDEDDLDRAKADQVEGGIGEFSLFHEEFGYYAEGIHIDTVVLPTGWRERLLRPELTDAKPAHPGHGVGVTGSFPNRSLRVALLHAGEDSACLISLEKSPGEVMSRWFFCTRCIRRAGALLRGGWIFRWHGFLQPFYRSGRREETSRMGDGCGRVGHDQPTATKRSGDSKRVQHVVVSRCDAREHDGDAAVLEFFDGVGTG